MVKTASRTTRSFRLPAILCLAALSGLAAWWIHKPSRPASFIFILADTLRADYLGAYGFQGPISPHLDALAEESVLFERAFATAPWTKPSMASVITSLEPHLHGLTNHGGQFWSGDPENKELRLGVLPHEALTLAEVLQAGGYETAGFVANPWLKKAYGFDQGFDVYDDRFASNVTPGRKILQNAQEWLNTRHNPEKPFFLYIHLMDAHGPYQAGPEDLHAIANSPSLGADRQLSPQEMAAIPGYLRRPVWAQSALSWKIRTWRHQYGAGVHSLDTNVGEFLREMRQSGLLRTTHLILTADHGEQLAEHGGWDHGTSLYDPEIHVPLMVRRPGGAQGGRRVPEMVSLLDLMPTFLDLAGLPRPEKLMGQSLQPLLEGHGLAQSRAGVLSGATKYQPNLFSWRTTEQKLLWDRKSGSQELYQLSEDPAEAQNLAAQKPEAAEKLRGTAEEYIQSGTHALDLESTVLSEEEKARMEALGYMNK